MDIQSRPASAILELASPRLGLGLGIGLHVPLPSVPARLNNRIIARINKNSKENNNLFLQILDIPDLDSVVDPMLMHVLTSSDDRQIGVKNRLLFFVISIIYHGRCGDIKSWVQSNYCGSGDGDDTRRVSSSTNVHNTVIRSYLYNAIDAYDGQSILCSDRDLNVLSEGVCGGGGGGMSMEKQKILLFHKLMDNLKTVMNMIHCDFDAFSLLKTLTNDNDAHLPLVATLLFDRWGIFAAFPALDLKYFINFMASSMSY